MRRRNLTAAVAAAMAIAVVAPAARGDDLGDRIRSVYENLTPSTVIVSFYVEPEKGGRVEMKVLGSVVGKGNLVMFSAGAISSKFTLDRFHDFQVLVTEGEKVTAYDSEYLGKDNMAQVAFVRTVDPEAPALPILEFKPDAKLEIGDPVVTLVNLGEPDAYKRVVQLARVAARVEQPKIVYLATGNLGVMGTPVVDLDGRAVGIIGVVRINRGTTTKPRVGVAEVVWPAERFAERIANPPEGGKQIKRPWLGVLTLKPLTKKLAAYFGIEGQGVIVGRVIDESPADEAGLEGEDIILSVGGEKVSGTEGQLVENFKNTLREMDVGSEVEMEVWRDGKTRTLSVTLAPQPKSPAEADRHRLEDLGLTVREMVLPDRVTRELSPEEATGVVVSFVEPAGWAGDAGLRPGDVIKKVQDRGVRDLEEFKEVVGDVLGQKPEEIILFVLRGSDQTKILRIEPHWENGNKNQGE